MLRLQQLGIRRGGRYIIKGVDLSLGRGEGLCLTGVAGCGKSTLLAAVAGCSGTELEVTGTIRADSPGIVVLRSRAVRVWQNELLTGPDTALLAMMARSGQGVHAIQHWNDEVGLVSAGTLSTPVGQLGPPLRRALLVCAQLLCPSPLYLVDEPTAGLDGHQAGVIRARLSMLARTSRVMLASRNRWDCLALPGSTALLSDGKVQQCRPNEEFFRCGGSAWV